MRRMMRASLSLSATVTRLALPLSSTCFSPSMYCRNTSPAAAASSMAKSRYSICSFYGRTTRRHKPETVGAVCDRAVIDRAYSSLRRGGGVCAKHSHELHESFVVGKRGERGLGFDLVRVLKT